MPLFEDLICTRLSDVFQARPTCSRPHYVDWDGQRGKWYEPEFGLAGRMWCDMGTSRVAVSALCVSSRRPVMF